MRSSRFSVPSLSIFAVAAVVITITLPGAPASASLTVPADVAGVAEGIVPPTAQARPVDDSCPATAVEEDGFVDVPAADPHEAAVDCVVHWQVAQGVTSSTYAPAAMVNRGQMASFLSRLVERLGGALSDPARDFFTDDNGSPHEGNVNRLAQAGVIGGRTERSYDPLSSVTRAQMAAFLTRTYDLLAAQSSAPLLAEGSDYFTDDDASAHEQAINKAAAAGFAAGYSAASYRPAAGVVRAQMASFLARVLDLGVEQGMSTLPLPGFRRTPQPAGPPPAYAAPTFNEIAFVSCVREEGGFEVLLRHTISGGSWEIRVGYDPFGDNSPLYHWDGSPYSQRVEYHLRGDIREDAPYTIPAGMGSISLDAPGQLGPGGKASTPNGVTVDLQACS